MKKIILIIALLVLLLIGAGGAWAYFAFLYAKPLTKAELAELTPDWDEATGGNWSPWFVEADGTRVWNPAASYNAWLATVPEEDKAWPVIIEAEYKFRDVMESKEAIWYIGTLPTDPERWAILAPVLGSPRCDEFTETLIEAYSKPVFGHELVHSTDVYEHRARIKYGVDDPNWDPSPTINPGMINANMFWVSTQRQNTNFLTSRAAWALEQGDTEQFITLIETELRVSALCDEFPSLLSGLVRAAMNGMVARALSWGLVAHPEQFDEPQLQRIDQALVAIGSYDIVWSGEKLAFHDILRRLLNDDGALSTRSMSRFAANGVTLDQPVSMPVEKLKPSAQRVLLVYQQLLDLAAAGSSLPWTPQISTEDFLASEADELNQLGNLYINIVAPATAKSGLIFLKSKQQISAQRVAIAAYRHRLRHGTFPDSLEDIDEDLLTIDPIDAFTGEPLKYKLTDLGPLIYSVGDDRVDDGGMIRWGSREVGELGDEKQIRVVLPPEWYTADEAQTMLQNNPESIKGDWVLFPMPVNDPEPVDEEDTDD